MQSARLKSAELAIHLAVVGRACKSLAETGRACKSLAEVGLAYNMYSAEVGATCNPLGRGRRGVRCSQLRSARRAMYCTWMRLDRRAMYSDEVRRAYNPLSWDRLGVQSSRLRSTGVQSAGLCCYLVLLCTFGCSENSCDDVRVCARELRRKGPVSVFVIV